MNKAILDHKNETASMVIDGHQITMSFSDQPNTGLAQLIKTTLIDAYIRENNIAAQN